MASFIEGLFNASKFEVLREESISAAEAAQVASAQVVEGTFGPEVCMIMKSGSSFRARTSRDSKLEVGDSVKPTSLRKLFLLKVGDDKKNVKIRLDGEKA